MSTIQRRAVNKEELEAKVKEMYREVAQNPHGDFHFETGWGLAEKLGYPSADLDKIPQEAIDSFAGVGYHLDLANIKKGEKVVDLGSGSGMDTFFAALKAGENGKVVGVDMTDEQMTKAENLRVRFGFDNVSFQKGYIEELPFEDESFDVVISNGVINLSAEKESVFEEVGRVLKRGGRLAISDIISEQELPEGITCDATIWASCIGGAMQIDRCKAAIEASGMRIISIRENLQYQFLSKSAQGASKKYGVKSISLLAEKL
ncbi:MAG TPA: methyltransferase domain-containing protein [Thermodesulfobacteriota bacterium]|nr:methyltransferase domain-containing protein [Thermodesulfobacteriota bacterium]